MYSGSPTIQSDDSFPSSSPMKTSDSTPEEFTDEYTHPNSLPPGDDVSILKKDFQEDTRKTNWNAEIKSSSSSTLTSPEASELEAYLEKDSIPPGIDLNFPPILKVSSSNPTSPTLTREKGCSWKTPMFFSLVRFVWEMMTRIAIKKKIICLLATYLHKKPKPLSQEVEEIKEKEDEVSSDVPIHTIVMPIRITFDNPIDFNDHFSKPKDFKKDLTISFDSFESSILPSPLLDSDSPFTAELSASVTLNSLGLSERGHLFKPAFGYMVQMRLVHLVLKEHLGYYVLNDALFKYGYVKYHKKSVKKKRTRERMSVKKLRKSKQKPDSRLGVAPIGWWLLRLQGCLELGLAHRIRGARLSNGPTAQAAVATPICTAHQHAKERLVVDVGNALVSITHLTARNGSRCGCLGLHGQAPIRVEGVCVAAAEVRQQGGDKATLEAKERVRGAYKVLRAVVA
ncbi:hypothetical protein Tco_0053037 [Tanacetum coccineum]